MRFAEPLIPGRLVRRYKRFLCDVALSAGETVTAHCPNPGAMLGLDRPRAEVWLARARPGTRLAYRWELVRVGRRLVGINTQRPNALVEEALGAGRIPELSGYASRRHEVPYGRRSRIDFLLETAGRAPCYVEVKNVHLKRADAAEFPDSVTARGTRHLNELAEAVAAGARAVMFYVVQRADCRRFAIASDLDPAYAAAFEHARAAGVEALCYACTVGRAGISIEAPLPVEGASPPLQIRRRGHL